MKTPSSNGNGVTSGNSKIWPDPFVVIDSMAAAYSEMAADKARDADADEYDAIPYLPTDPMRSGA